MQDTFPVGGDAEGEGGDAAPKPAFLAVRWRRFASAEDLAGEMAPVQTEAGLWPIPER